MYYVFSRYELFALLSIFGPSSHGACGRGEGRPLSSLGRRDDERPKPRMITCDSARSERGKSQGYMHLSRVRGVGNPMRLKWGRRKMVLPAHPRHSIINSINSIGPGWLRRMGRYRLEIVKARWTSKKVGGRGRLLPHGILRFHLKEVPFGAKPINPARRPQQSITRPVSVVLQTYPAVSLSVWSL